MHVSFAVGAVVPHPSDLLRGGYPIRLVLLPAAEKSTFPRADRSTATFSFTAANPQANYQLTGPDSMSGTLTNLTTGMRAYNSLVRGRPLTSDPTRIAVSRLPSARTGAPALACRADSQALSASVIRRIRDSPWRMPS